MSCYIGRIHIVNNEGTIFFGDVNSLPPSNASKNNEGSTEVDTEEGSLDNNRLSLSIPINPIVPEVIMSKRKNRNRTHGMMRGSKVKRSYRPSDV